MAALLFLCLLSVVQFPGFFCYSLDMRKISQQKPKTEKKNPDNTPKKSVNKSRRKLTPIGWLLVALAVAVCTGIGIEVLRKPSMKEQLSRTYLDELKITNLNARPASSYEDSVEVQDYSIYGTSLLFYSTPYTPFETDAFFGRNAVLKNIETGENVSTTFSGGADSGFDLQTLDPGVYEVYLSDGYTPKRAYMENWMQTVPITLFRDNKKTRSVQINADSEYLSQFNIHSDKNYLYVTVTETLPMAKVTDVVLDPSGLQVDSSGYLLEDFSEEGFDENQQSWQLAQRVKVYLESAGLKVTISRAENVQSGYLGTSSRTAVGYNEQAKVFVSLAMSTADVSRPYVVSDPFTNGRLGNQICYALAKDGIELYRASLLAELNPGNSYDTYSVNEEYAYEPYSLLPQLRETGGKITSAGKASAWTANASFSDSYGMDAVVVYYASADNADSRGYYLEHREEIAKGIAQGIVAYAGIDAQVADNPDEVVSQDSAQEPTAVEEAPVSSEKQDGE